MEKVSIAEGVNWATRASRQATAVHQGISCSEVSDVALSTDADSDYDEFPAGGSFYVFLDALAWSYVSSMEAEHFKRGRMLRAIAIFDQHCGTA